jgi:chemotaxis-related protein WspB
MFQLGKERYALEASRVVEVAPLLALKRLPQAPKGVAGIFNYRGRPVPALDLSELALGVPSSERLSTRIIVVNYQTANGSSHLLGLIAEHATEMLRKDPKEFVEPGLKIDAAPYLGPVLIDSRGAIQWLDTQRLLSESTRSLLFSDSPEPAVQPQGSADVSAT